MIVDHGLREYGWKSSDPTGALEYTLPAIIALLPKKQGLSILDAGCGNGVTAGELAKLGHRVTGIDLSEDGIIFARKKYPEVHFQVASVYSDIQSLLNHKKVDVVISSEVIEHLYYPKRFLRNMYSIIQPGGCIILTTPYHGYLKNIALSLFDHWDKHHTVDWEGGHIKFFSEKTLTRMLRESGFSNVHFNNAGRVRWLWKSMVCRAQKRDD